MGLTAGKIPKASSADHIEDGYGVVTTVGDPGTDDDIPTEQAIREALDLKAGTAHAASHTDGTDDVQDASAAQKGLMTQAYASKLDGIEAAADVTDAANVTAAGAVMTTTIDAKGDLFAGTGDNALARLPVGANETVIISDSGEATGVRWDKSPFPKEYINGLQLSYINANTVRIGTGICRSDDDLANLILASTEDVNLSASGAGGLDTGSEAANTWYYIWLIYNPTTTNYAGMFSLSGSSPTMPSGYTRKRLLGAVRNNSSSNILKFEQLGKSSRREIHWDVNAVSLLVLAGGNATTFTAVNCAAVVSPLADEIRIATGFTNTNATDAYSFRQTGWVATTAVNIFSPGIILTSSNYSCIITPCNTSQQFDYKVSVATNSLTLAVKAYWENL